MSKKKDLARRQDSPKPLVPSRTSDAPDQKMMLTVLRTREVFKLATNVLVAVAVIWCARYVYEAVVGVAGKTTNYNFNFTVDVAITLALSAAISIRPFLTARREKKRGDRLSAENDHLREQRALDQLHAAQAEKRAEDLAADLKALRRDRDR